MHKRRRCERLTNKDVGRARTWRQARRLVTARRVDPALFGSGSMTRRRDSQKSAALRREIRRWVDQSGVVVFLTRGGPMDRLVWRMHEAMS